MLAGVSLSTLPPLSKQAFASTAPSVRILVVGDSISAEYGLPRGSGWVPRLQQRLDATGKKYQVINASISGDTTSGGLSRLPQLLNKHQPSVAILELGANDALRGLSLQQTRNNLEAMIAMCRQTLLKGIADAPDSQRWFLPDRLHPNAPRRRTGFWKTSGHLYGACWTEQIQALTPKHRFRAVETPSMPESA